LSASGWLIQLKAMNMFVINPVRYIVLMNAVITNTTMRHNHCCKVTVSVWSWPVASSRSPQPMPFSLWSIFRGLILIEVYGTSKFLHQVSDDTAW